MRPLLCLTLSALCSQMAAATVTAAPVSRSLDASVISRIRDQGSNHSHVMTYATELFDGIGPRLTGSPQFERAARWCVAQLQAIGAAKAHAEPWGEFGLGWTQNATSVVMQSPEPATLVAQAVPWSPATPGAVTGPAIVVPLLRSAADLSEWKGRLAGRVVLYGDPGPADPDKVPSMIIWDETRLRAMVDAPAPSGSSAQHDANVHFYQQLAFDERVDRFFASEGVIAVLRAGGDGGAVHDDNSLAMGSLTYRPEHRQTIPAAVVASEGFRRMSRLLSRGTVVTVSVDIRTQFDPKPATGANVLADIPGEDPTVSRQVVMIGGHLDSWAAGTGATDDGAAVVVAIEAIRILKAAGVHPHRTIRISLWGGEEQGDLGSRAYVQAHYAKLTYADDPGMAGVPLGYRAPVSVERRPEAADLDLYLNADHGAGRYLGLNASGDPGAAALFRRWMAPLADLGADTITLRRTEQVDSDSFHDAGLPAFDFLQSPRDDSRTHHTNLDVYERLPEEDLKQAATVLALVAYTAAMDGERLAHRP